MINQIKTVLFLGILTGLLLVIGALIGGQSGLTIALFIAIAMNFISYFFSHKIVLAMYKAKEVDKTKNPELYEMVRDIALRASIPTPKIYIIPSENPNAFATGPNPKKAVVAVTKGIMGLLSKDELKGVLAHEIAHIKNRDILISTIAATIAGAISYLAFMARFAAIFGGMRGDGDNSNIFELIALAIIAPIVAVIIQLAISRSREFLADSTGAKIVKDPNSLADALQKLNTSAKEHPMKMGNQATAHMFIVNPFTAKSFFKLFSTHPDINQRIGKLRSMII